MKKWKISKKKNQFLKFVCAPPGGVARTRIFLMNAIHIIHGNNLQGEIPTTQVPKIDFAKKVAKK